MKTKPAQPKPVMAFITATKPYVRYEAADPQPKPRVSYVYRPGHKRMVRETGHALKNCA